MVFRACPRDIDCNLNSSTYRRAESVNLWSGRKAGKERECKQRESEKAFHGSQPFEGQSALSGDIILR